MAQQKQERESSIHARNADTGKDELYQSMIEQDHVDNVSQEQTSIQELPKEVMQAMEMENYSNVEIPNSGCDSAA